MKVRIYWNLHKELYSVQEQIDGKWLVTQHLTNLTLLNPTARVYQAGRQRTIKTHSKNVHAYLIGDLIINAGNDVRIGALVTYNPFTDSSFMVCGQPFNPKLFNSLHLSRVWKIDKYKPFIIAV